MGICAPANAIMTPEGVLRLTNLRYQGRDDGEALLELKQWFARRAKRKGQGSTLGRQIRGLWL